MGYLLDTNACVNHLKSPGQTGLSRRLGNANPADIVLCSVVKAELIYGALRSREVEKNIAKLERFFAQFISLPFDDRAADHCGRIRAYLAEHGNPIGPNDLLIASVALASNLTLVTHNTNEFRRVPQLNIEDWELTSP